MDNLKKFLLFVSDQRALIIIIVGLVAVLAFAVNTSKSRLSVNFFEGNAAPANCESLSSGLCESSGQCEWYSNSCHIPSCGGLLRVSGKNDPSRYDAGCFPSGPPSGQGWQYAGQTNDCGSTAGDTSRGCFWKSKTTISTGISGTSSGSCSSMTSQSSCLASANPVCEWYNNICQIPSCGAIINRLGKTDSTQYDIGCFSNGVPLGQNWVYAGQTNDCGNIANSISRGCFWKPKTVASLNTPPSSTITSPLTSCGGLLNDIGKNDPALYDVGCFGSVVPSGQGWQYAGQTNDCGSKADDTSRGCFWKPKLITLSGNTSTPTPSNPPSNPSSGINIGFTNSNGVAYVTNPSAGHPVANDTLLFKAQYLEFKVSTAGSCSDTMLISRTKALGARIYWKIDGAIVNNKLLDFNLCYDRGISEFSWVATPGTHKIEAVVDPDNRVPESNESDNSASKVVIVGGSACGSTGQTCCVGTGSSFATVCYDQSRCVDSKCVAYESGVSSSQFKGLNEKCNNDSECSSGYCGVSSSDKTKKSCANVDLKASAVYVLDSLTGSDAPKVRIGDQNNLYVDNRVNLGVAQNWLWEGTNAASLPRDLFTKWYVDGNLIGESRGSATDRYFSIYFTPTQAKNYTIKAVVDAGNVFNETNEQNNVATKTITVKPVTSLPSCGQLLGQKGYTAEKGYSSWCADISQRENKNLPPWTNRWTFAGATSDCGFVPGSKITGCFYCKGNDTKCPKTVHNSD